jgi:hypothetical protein
MEKISGEELIERFRYMDNRKKRWFNNYEYTNEEELESIEIGEEIKIINRIDNIREGPYIIKEKFLGGGEVFWRVENENGRRFILYPSQHYIFRRVYSGKKDFRYLVETLVEKIK